MPNVTGLRVDGDRAGRGSQHDLPEPGPLEVDGRGLYRPGIEGAKQPDGVVCRGRSGRAHGQDQGNPKRNGARQSGAATKRGSTSRRATWQDNVMRTGALIAVTLPLTALGVFDAQRATAEEAAPSALRAETLQRAFFHRETERIRTHLERAESILREGAPQDLLPSQRAARLRTLDALRAYREQGRFPWNDVASIETPIFVDDRGTRCAMGHLLDEAGYSDLVEQVRATDNLATVYELASDGALDPYLDALGITVEEAAMIQPSYRPQCFSRTDLLCVGPDGDLLAEAKVRSREAWGDEHRLEVEVSSVEHGDMSVGETRGVTTSIDVAVGETVLLLGSAHHPTLLGADGANVFVTDPCGVSLDLPRNEVYALARSPTCVDELETRDPRWAGGYCRQPFGSPAECPEDVDDGIETDDGQPVPEPEQPAPEAPVANDASATSRGGCSGAGSAPAAWMALGGLVVGWRRRWR